MFLSIVRFTTSKDNFKIKQVANINDREGKEYESLKERGPYSTGDDMRDTTLTFAIPSIELLQ